MVAEGWSIAFRPYGVVWAVLALVLVGLAWYSYRTTVPAPGPRARHILVALRIVAIVLLSLALLGPRIEWRGDRPREPRIAVLIDRSKSLSFTDALGPRPEAVARILGSSGADRLKSEGTVGWQGFAAKVATIDPGDIAFDGDATAIGDALLEQRRRVPSPDAIVLVSDGANNTGPDPVRAAGEIGIPVYAIGIGDPRPQPDIRVAGVTAPEIALAGKPVTVVATVENTALAARPVNARIVAGGRTVVEKRIDLPPPGRRADIDLVFTPSATGTLRAHVAVDEVPGEIVAQNNIRPFSMEVLRAKRRILVLAGAPSADLQFWMRLFHTRESYDVRLWLAPHPVHRLGVPPLAPADLAETDLIIWNDLPPNALPESQIGSVVAAVRGGAGILVVPGRAPIPRALAPILPAATTPTGATDQPSQPALTEQAARHPIVAADPDYPRWSARWSTLPPLPRPDGGAPAEGRGDGAPRGGKGTGGSRRRGGTGSRGDLHGHRVLAMGYRPPWSRRDGVAGDGVLERRRPLARDAAIARPGSAAGRCVALSPG